MSEAGERMLEGAREALAIAKGERPAASIWINGHHYVPDIQWQPIESAPIAEMAWLWAPAWRHAFPGQRIGDFGRVYIDTCETEARGREDFATHWMPLPSPPLTNGDTRVDD